MATGDAISAEGEGATAAHAGEGASLHVDQSRREAHHVVDQRGAQTGDQSYRDVAGRDVHHEDNRVGADANQVLDFLRTYVFHADQARETAIKELKRDLTHELRLVRGDVAIQSDALRTVRDRVDRMADDRERERLERQRRQTALDLRLLGLAALIVVVFVLLAWLLYDRYAAATVLRYWIGGGMALAAAAARALTVAGPDLGVRAP